MSHVRVNLFAGLLPAAQEMLRNAPTSSGASTASDSEDEETGRLDVENAQLHAVIVSADAEIALLRAQIVELRRPNAMCPGCVKLRSELAACRAVSDCATATMQHLIERIRDAPLQCDSRE